MPDPGSKGHHGLDLSGVSYIIIGYCLHLQLRVITLKEGRLSGDTSGSADASEYPHERLE
jgi:hypothetical protein